MKIVRNNVLVLLAHKSTNEGRRITLKKAADETGISYYTMTAIANNTIKEYPAEALAKLCQYLGCDIGDVLSLVEQS
jgi:DNA-binding Xre family transcriptional regulator